MKILKDQGAWPAFAIGKQRDDKASMQAARADPTICCVRVVSEAFMLTMSRSKGSHDKSVSSWFSFSWAMRPICSGRVASEQVVNDVSPGKVRRESFDRSCEASQDPTSMRRANVARSSSRTDFPMPGLASNDDRSPLTTLKRVLQLATFTRSTDNLAVAIAAMRSRDGYGAKRRHQGVTALDVLRRQDREADGFSNRLRSRGIAEDAPSRQFHQSRRRVDCGADKTVFAALAAAVVSAE